MAPAASTAAAGTGAVSLFTWDRCTPGAAAVQLPTTTGSRPHRGIRGRRPALSRAIGAFVAYPRASAARAPGTSPWSTSPASASPPCRTRPRRPTTVDLSADGATLAYDFAAQVAAPTSIYVGPPGQLAAATVPAAAGLVQAMPSLSADGATVAFVATGGGTLRPYVFNTIAGVVALVDGVSAGQIVQPAITPDASQVAYVVAAGTAPSGLATAGATSIVVSRSTSGRSPPAPRRRSARRPCRRARPACRPAISATGQTVVFATTNGSGSDMWSAQRAPALTVTPAFDLGTVPIGSSSPPAAVTFTNPSTVGIVLGPVTALAAPFSITADTCSNLLVPPTGTCTVTVVFTPTTDDESTTSLTVAGTGRQRHRAAVRRGPRPRPGDLDQPVDPAVPDHRRRLTRRPGGGDGDEQR